MTKKRFSKNKNELKYFISQNCFLKKASVKLTLYKKKKKSFKNQNLSIFISFEKSSNLSPPLNFLRAEQEHKCMIEISQQIIFFRHWNKTCYECFIVKNTMEWKSKICPIIAQDREENCIKKLNWKIKFNIYFCFISVYPLPYL